MTKPEFLAAHRHTLAGLMMRGVIDGQAHGNLTMFMKCMYANIDDCLGSLWDEAHKTAAPERNGVHPKKEGTK